MDDKTKMSGNGRVRTEMPDVAGSVSNLTCDVLELSELQARLLMLDLKKSSQRARTCAIMAIVSICFLLGSIPVVLLFLAEVIVEQLEWTRSLALGITTLIGLGVAGILAAAAWTMLKDGLISLDRSRNELKHNVEWIKSTLRNRQSPRAEQSRNY